MKKVSTYVKNEPMIINIFPMEVEDGAFGYDVDLGWRKYTGADWRKALVESVAQTVAVLGVYYPAVTSGKGCVSVLIKSQDYWNWAYCADDFWCRIAPVPDMATEEYYGLFDCTPSPTGWQYEKD